MPVVLSLITFVVASIFTDKKIVYKPLKQVD